MNSHLLYTPIGVYNATSVSRESKSLKNIGRTGSVIVTPLKSVILSFWKVWTAKID